MKTRYPPPVHNFNSRSRPSFELKSRISRRNNAESRIPPNLLGALSTITALMKSEPVHQNRTLWHDPSPITALMKMYLVTGRVVDVNVVRYFQSSREFRANHERRAKVKVWFLLKINSGFKVNNICFSMCTICGFAWDSPAKCVASVKPNKVSSNATHPE